MNNLKNHTIAKEDDVFVLSADKHKMNALFYDKIFPMHSVKKVPAKYQVDITFYSISDFPAYNRFLPLFIDFINGVQKSPVDKILLQHCILFGGDGLLDENGSYHDLFNSNILKEYKSVCELNYLWPFSWLRDAATLLNFEMLCLNGYKNVIPIFTSNNLYPEFIKKGGLFFKPNYDEESHKPIIEVVQNYYYELIEEKTEWEQIGETRKDIESLRKIQNINRILTAEYRDKEKNACIEQIDKTISDFEDANRKHGLHFKRAKQYLYLDIATAASLSLFSVISYINGEPLLVTLSALAGATFSTTKAVLDFSEKVKTIELDNTKIISYIESAKDEIEGKFGGHVIKRKKKPN